MFPNESILINGDSILKSYLRSTMSQEWLNGLALISIEHEFLEKLDYDGLIDDFASKSARRSVFRKEYCTDYFILVKFL